MIKRGRSIDPLCGFMHYYLETVFMQQLWIPFPSYVDLQSVTFCRFGGVENGQSFHAEHWHETRDARGLVMPAASVFPTFPTPISRPWLLWEHREVEVLPSNKSQRGSAQCCIMQPYASINRKQNNNSIDR